jgi:hypothetical protein
VQQLDLEVSAGWVISYCIQAHALTLKTRAISLQIGSQPRSGVGAGVGLPGLGAMSQTSEKAPVGEVGAENMGRRVRIMESNRKNYSEESQVRGDTCRVPFFALCCAPNPSVQPVHPSQRAPKWR